MVQGKYVFLSIFLKRVCDLKNYKAYYNTLGDNYEFRRTNASQNNRRLEQDP